MSSMVQETTRNALVRNIMNDEYRTNSTTTRNTPSEATVTRFRQFAAIIHTTSIGEHGYEFELTAQLWNLALGKELWRVSRVIELHWEYTRGRVTAINQEGAVTVKFRDLECYVFIKDGVVTGINKYEYDHRFSILSAFRDDGALYKVCERKFHYGPSEISLYSVHCDGKGTQIALLPEFSRSSHVLHWSHTHNHKYFVLCLRKTNVLFVYNSFVPKHFICTVPGKNDWYGTLFLLDDCLIVSKEDQWVPQFTSTATIVSTYKITSDGLDLLKEVAIEDSPELCFINQEYGVLKSVGRNDCTFRLFDFNTQESTLCTSMQGKSKEIHLTVSDGFLHFNNIYGHASIYDLKTKTTIQHSQETHKAGKSSSFECGIRLTTHTTDKGIALKIDDYNPNSELYVDEDAS